MPPIFIKIHHSLHREVKNLSGNSGRFPCDRRHSKYCATRRHLSIHHRTWNLIPTSPNVTPNIAFTSGSERLKQRFQAHLFTLPRIHPVHACMTTGSVFCRYKRAITPSAAKCMTQNNEFLWAIAIAQNMMYLF